MFPEFEEQGVTPSDVERALEVTVKVGMLLAFVESASKGWRHAEARERYWQEGDNIGLDKDEIAWKDVADRIEARAAEIGFSEFLELPRKRVLDCLGFHRLPQTAHNGTYRAPSGNSRPMILTPSSETNTPHQAPA